MRAVDIKDPDKLDFYATLFSEEKPSGFNVPTQLSLNRGCPEKK